MLSPSIVHEIIMMKNVYSWPSATSSSYFFRSHRIVSIISHCLPRHIVIIFSSPPSNTFVVAGMTFRKHFGMLLLLD